MPLFLCPPLGDSHPVRRARCRARERSFNSTTCTLQEAQGLHRSHLSFSVSLPQSTFCVMAKDKNDHNNTVHRKVILKSGFLYQGQISRKTKKFFQLVKTDDHFVTLEYFKEEPTDKTKNIYKPNAKAVNISTAFEITRKSPEISPKKSFSCGKIFSSSTPGHVFYVYTCNHRFAYACESEKSLEEWMEALVSAKQLSINALMLEARFLPLFPMRYDHVWQVTVVSVMRGKRRLDDWNEIFSRVIRICFLCAHRSLHLYRVNSRRPYTFFDPGHPNECHELYIQDVRKIGHTKKIFSLETGRGAPLGSLILRVDAEDASIAGHMHAILLDAMKSAADVSAGLCDIPRRMSMHSHQASTGRSLSCTVLDPSFSCSERDLVAHGLHRNDDYIDLDTSNASSLNQAADGLRRTRFWSERRDSGYPEVPLSLISSHSALNRSISSGFDGHLICESAVNRSYSVNCQQSHSAKPTVLDDVDEEGYVRMYAPNLFGPSFWLTPHADSMRPFPACSYGSCPTVITGSRRNNPSRSDILDSFTKCSSSTSLTAARKESTEETRDTVADLTTIEPSNVSSGDNKSTRSSSVP